MAVCTLESLFTPQVSSVGKCSVPTVGEIRYVPVHQYNGCCILTESVCSSAVEEGVVEKRQTEVGEGGRRSRPLSATECDAPPPRAHAPVPVKGPVL